MAVTIFIVNPHAGNGKGRRVWRTIEKECEKTGFDYRTYFTERQGHAKDIAKQVVTLYHKKMRAIVVVGGDGTLHEVYNGCIDRPDLPIGVIPAGSGNDFARSFSIPSSPLRAFRRLQKRGFKKIDTGRLTFEEQGREVIFVNSAGAGFDSEVARASNESTCKKILNQIGLGQLAYSLIVMRLVLTYKPSNVTVSVDGNTNVFRDVWLTAVSNIPFYGGGMKIAPSATVDDGLFNICVVHNMNRLKLIFLFITVFFGRHVNLRNVTLLKGRQIRIDGEQPLPVHVDGETAAETPIAINNQHRSRLML